MLIKNPKASKIIGAILIFVGLLALATPLTPGAWLIFIGLEFFGIRLLAWDKLKTWFLNKKNE